MPDGHTAQRIEIARGAAAVGAVAAKKYPYATAYRLIRSRMEENVQRRRDSDAFRLGAHLAAAAWVKNLPEDVDWRATALARHRDTVQWLLPRVGMASDDIARAVAQAAELKNVSEQQLLDWLDSIKKSAPQRASEPRRDPR